MLLGFSPASTMLLSLSAAFGTATMLLSLSRPSRSRDDAAQLVAGLDDASQLVGGLGEGPTARAVSVIDLCCVTGLVSR